jgi:glycosyltransferase involved in cell wall biosynthesis
MRQAPTHLRQAAVKGLYERAYGPLMDRVWVVSDVERRAMRFVSGCRRVDVLPNGVDLDAFQPSSVVPDRHSVVFWGRLGFGPNLQALRWFCSRVWPLLRGRVADCSFSVLGADPPDEIRALDGRDGIRVTANLADLRPAISRGEVTVLPIVSGGGIKNKLLEAAAMGRPIVATTRATGGVRSAPPIAVADTPDAFADAVMGIWQSADRGTQLGLDARDWVARHHSWAATARDAEASVARQ